jgi:hypothetical protein
MQYLSLSILRSAVQYSGIFSSCYDMFHTSNSRIISNVTYIKKYWQEIAMPVSILNRSLNNTIWLGTFFIIFTDQTFVTLKLWYTS